MFWLSVAGGIFLVWLVLVFLFTPGISYHLGHRTSIHDKEFLYTLQSTCQASLHHGNRVTVFTNGVAFYPAMLETISQATHSINMELYIFQPGKIADQFVTELSAKARQGVIVIIVVDWLGSVALWGRPVRRLRKAGCRIQSYQSPRWYSLPRLNNRTHRELLVVDGRVAFIGGAGVADWWALPHAAASRAVARHDGADRRTDRRGAPGRLRRELARVLRRDPDRAAATGPILKAGGETTAMRRQELAVGSRHRVAGTLPDADRRRRSRACDISTPYFLPDRALRRALVRDGAPRRAA